MLFDVLKFAIISDIKKERIILKQHMIAIDLDGTTLNNHSQLTNKTIQTLRQLDEMGHLITIVTGRPYRTAKDIYHQLNINAGIVNFNGALCHHPRNKHWIPSYHHELDKEIAFEIFANQDTLGIDMLMAEGRDQLFTTSMNLPDSPFYPKDKAKIALLSREELTYNPTALTIFCPIEDQEKIATRLENHYGDYISVRTWGGFLPILEVVRNGINKAVGVKQIADFYHIPRENILAFGDEDNDLEMIEYAGLGVAMNNAIPEIKAIANDETEFTNNEEGLAEYLIKHFNLNIK